MILNFLKQHFFGQGFESSTFIPKSPKDLYNYLKVPTNWVKIDLHDLLYIQNNQGKDILNMRTGRGFLSMRVDDMRRHIFYSIDDFTEGKWKFWIKIESANEGSKLLFKCKSPRGITSSVFYNRIAGLTGQFHRLRDGHTRTTL